MLKTAPAWRLMAVLAGCMVAALVCAPAAMAEPSAAPQASAAAGGSGLWDSLSRKIFSFNKGLYAALDGGAGPTIPKQGAPASSSGAGHVVSNLINEPVTVLASLATLDWRTAQNATVRFAVNTTYGVLGWWDEATRLGYPPKPADAGLSLCKWGVGEGGYIVLPFIGPRTVRDGAADIVLMNIVLWTALGAVLDTGFSVQTVVLAETLEIAADTFGTRQMDPRAKALDYDDYDAMRTAYLAQRRERCSDHGK